MEVEEGTPVEADPISNINSIIESLQASKQEMSELLQAAQSKLEDVDRKLNLVMAEFKELTAPGEVDEDANDTSIEGEDLNAYKLSPVASHALSESNGPIPTSNLQNFLMKDVWGKPRPAVLPIIRTYTPDIQGTVQQMLDIRHSLQGAHVNYKEQRRLDENLIRRIDKLVKNVERELKEEAEKNRHQQPITRFLTQRSRHRSS